MTNEIDSAACNSVCPQCGSTFSCGVKAGSDHCWCADLPPLAEPDGAAAATSCYCVNCLRQRISPDQA